MSNAPFEPLTDKKSWLKPGLVLSQEEFETVTEKTRQDTSLAIDEVKQRMLNRIETQEKK